MMPQLMPESPQVLIEHLAQQARTASRVLARATTAQKNKALFEAAYTIRARKAQILKANAQDCSAAAAAGQSAAYLDRLVLDASRIDGIAASLESIASQPDPIGHCLQEWQQPNGLHIRKIRVPLGVVGIIFESRPNVTADAGALCLKSGNAALLRCGSDSLQSSLALLNCLHSGLQAAGLPLEAIQLVPTADRDAVGAMLTAVGLIDVIIPRGGKSLVARVAEESRVPVIKHLDGNCHVYIDATADVGKAVAITLNAKMRRVGICGAAETVLLHQDILHTTGKAVIQALLEAGCSVHGDVAISALDSRIQHATEQDWQTEYLAPTIAAKTVADVEEAITHINRYGSQHTDSIITQDDTTATTFLNGVDSAIVMVNTSTQFADGGEFGFGAEIGISTDKFHARGPVGAEHLTSYQYQVCSNGAVRP